MKKETPFTLRFHQIFDLEGQEGHEMLVMVMQ